MAWSMSSRGRSISAEPSRLLRAVAALACACLVGCGGGRGAALHPNETPELRAMIEATSRRHGAPSDLVQRVVIRESGHRPAARNGRYLGLMQLDPRTARTMGYRGEPEGLLDAKTNLTYGVKYLRGAWLVAEGDRDAAVGWYSRGYYYEAKRKGLLEETGLQ